MFRVALIDMFNADNFGLRCISASLKRHGCEVYSIYGTTGLQFTKGGPERKYQGFCKVIRDLRPDLVGVSVVSTFSHPHAAELANRIKAFSDVPIIFGGASPTLLPEWTLKNALIDYVCIGDGDNSLAELTRVLSSSRANTSVQGIMSKMQPDYKPGSLVTDLDSLPIPSFADENTYSIEDNGTVRHGDLATNWDYYTTRCSRGCPFSCTYCSNPQLRSLSGEGKYLRQRSVSRVIEEIRQNLQFMPSCSRVSFTDDNFPASPAWIKEFSDQYARHIGLPFRIWFNPNSMKEKQIALLASAGLRWVKVGIQSANDHTRQQVFRRRESRETILTMDRILAKNGVERSYDFILDHPWESETELQDTHELLMEFKRPFTIAMHSLILLPRTKLAERAVEEGLVDHEDSLIEHMTSDTVGVSRRFLWHGVIPDQHDPIREYRIRLLFWAQFPWMPKWLIKAALSPGILKSREIVRHLLKIIKKSDFLIGGPRTGFWSARLPWKRSRPDRKSVQ